MRFGFCQVWSTMVGSARTIWFASHSAWRLVTTTAELRARAAGRAGAHAGTPPSHRGAQRARRPALAFHLRLWPTAVGQRRASDRPLYWMRPAHRRTAVCGRSRRRNRRHRGKLTFDSTSDAQLATRTAGKRPDHLPDSGRHLRRDRDRRGRVLHARPAAGRSGCS
jgi:hypothetical protein